MLSLPGHYWNPHLIEILGGFGKSWAPYGLLAAGLAISRLRQARRAAAMDIQDILVGSTFAAGLSASLGEQEAATRLLNFRVCSLFIILCYVLCPFSFLLLCLKACHLDHLPQ